MQRPSDRDPRAPGDRRVGLFIDYDNLRRGIEDPGGDADLAGRLRDLAQEQGRVLVAAAYGDWSASRTQAREFRRHQIEPRLVLSKDGAEERADLALSLDVIETLYLGPDLDLFVLVAGETPYHELVARLRRADKSVVLVGLEGGTAASYRGQDRFIPVDELLGARRAPRRVAPPFTPAHSPAAAGPPRRPVDFDHLDWAPFIRLMDELEASMPFVGFGWLLKKKLSPENSGCSSMHEKQELMDRANEQGVLVLYKVDNIDEGADPVTACKLNRDSPLVKDVLGV